jgi:NADPH-dependent ferric siderophore reductase
MGYYDTYYRAEVLTAGRLTPNMVRVRFGGSDLARFTSTGVADERLVVVFPEEGAEHAPPPERQADGTYDYPDDATRPDMPRPEMRSYTVRAWDPVASEMVIDFVAHRGGVAAQWALQASPGQVVYLSEAAGWYEPPADAEWQLLVADMTALPALGRIVEQLPAGQRAYVIAEVISHADRQPLTSAAEISSRWLVGSGHGLSPCGLGQAVADFTWPEGPGYVWFAGEAAESRAVRKHLRRIQGWSAERYEILGYWRIRKEEWAARYDQVGAELEQVYTRAVAEGHTSTDALELYDEALEKAGL